MPGGSSAWGGFWALTRHRDVSEAAADSATFITSKQNVVPKVAFTGRRPPLHLDPPEHTPYRRALAPLLAEKRIARFEPAIRAICRELMAPKVTRGGGDICGVSARAHPRVAHCESAATRGAGSPGGAALQHRRNPTINWRRGRPACCCTMARDLVAE
jgi:cytochrome P450